MPAPRIASVNVGLPVAVRIDGNEVLTGIFKEPVDGRIRIVGNNLVGDAQADLTVHGGPDKAVYAYPSAHYPLWSTELERDLTYGMFGENLTIDGLDEPSVRVGDELRIGSALLAVTIPRRPCFKLASKFGRNDIIKRFARSGRSGFYLAVIEEGEVGAGDAIVVERTSPDAPTIAEVLESIYRRPR